MTLLTGVQSLFFKKKKSLPTCQNVENHEKDNAERGTSEIGGEAKNESLCCPVQRRPPHARKTRFNPKVGF